MNIDITDLNGIEILRLNGKLDLAGASELRKQMDHFLGLEFRRFHFNLGNLEFIDNTGLGLLLSLAKEIRESKGRLTFSDLNGYVSELFDTTHLNRIFEIFPNQEEALNSYLAATLN